MTKKSPKNSHKISQFLHVNFGFLNMVSCPNCASFKKWQNLSQIYEIFDQNLMKFLTFLIFVKILTHLFLNLLIVIWQFLKYFKNNAQAVNSEKWSKCLKPLPGQVHDGLKKWSKNGHFWWFFWWFFRLALLHVTFWSTIYKFWVQN